MKELLESLISEMATRIKGDIIYLDETLVATLKAYNTWQEEEYDGVGYLFDLHNPDDLKCCIEGGMTAAEIAQLHEKSYNSGVPYFYYGVNYETPQMIENHDELVQMLSENLQEMLPYVLAYPSRYEELYSHYVTDYVMEHIV